MNEMKLGQFAAEADLGDGVKRNHMKFLNGDDCLNDIVNYIRKSEKRISVPNADLLAEAVCGRDWS